MKPSTCAAFTLALASVFSTTAHAKPVNVTGCTLDGKRITLNVDIEGTATPNGTSSAQPLSDVIQHVFASTAQTLSAKDMIDQQGWRAFQANMNKARSNVELSDDARVTISGAPTINGTCTP